MAKGLASEGEDFPRRITKGTEPGRHLIPVNRIKVEYDSDKIIDIDSTEDEEIVDDLEDHSEDTVVQDKKKGGKAKPRGSFRKQVAEIVADGADDTDEGEEELPAKRKRKRSVKQTKPVPKAKKAKIVPAAQP